MDDRAWLKARHHYVYNGRFGIGNRGVYQYAGQIANGAPLNGGMVAGGVMPGGVVARTAAAAYPVGVGLYPQCYSVPYRPVHYANYSYPSSYSSYSYPSYYSGYSNPGLYGYNYSYANYYHPYQRSYCYTTPTVAAVPATYSYSYPHAATTRTTYTVTNSHATPVNPAPSLSAPATGACSACHHACPHHGPTREEIQMENRRVATERGAYNPRRIKPADARDDDPFWCRERNGEWHLRSFYQIENECHPGRWLMDAEMGFLVFHRD